MLQYLSHFIVKLIISILYHQLHNSDSYYYHYVVHKLFLSSLKESGVSTFFARSEESPPPPLSKSLLCDYISVQRENRFLGETSRYLLFYYRLLQSRDIFIDYTLRQILLCSVIRIVWHCVAMHCIALHCINVFYGVYRKSRALHLLSNPPWSFCGSKSHNKFKKELK